MEALACGLPCLVSDIPANKEWVREQENGWLFPDGNVEALATKILAVIEKRESLIEIGKNARRTAEEKANWPKNFEKLLAAYELVPVSARDEVIPVSARDEGTPEKSKMTNIDQETSKHA